MTNEYNDPQRPDGDDDNAPDLHFDFPPPNFNALTATADELCRYGLPQRPDPNRTPELYRAWTRLFQEPLTFEPPDLQFVEVFTQEPEIRQVLPDTSRIEKSQNWCGASIVPHGGNQFVSMYGEWTVPTPSLPPPQEWGPNGPAGDYHCTAWIGLDGNRRYLNSSLPQVGTEQVLKVDAAGQPQPPEYSAWFQWWARTQVHITRKVFKKIQVQAGLQVMAAIWVIDPRHVGVMFRTFAPFNQGTVLFRKSPPVWLRQVNGPTGRPTISGATAEWIVERPETLTLNHPTLDLFPAYTPVTFDFCVAGAARAPGPPTSEEILTGPRFFWMYEVPPALLPRTRLISMAEPVSTTSLRVHYGGF
jgi:hypothetical protein